MREGLAAGLTERQVANFANPAAYRGMNDPNGGGRLLRDLTPEQLHALAKYAGDQKGTGLVQHGSTEAQANFFKAFPELQAKYMELAGVTAPATTVAPPPTEETTSTGPLFQPFTGMTGEQTGVPGYPLTPYASFDEAMQAAQTNLASHYASAAAAGDFTAAGSAFTQLQQHQEFMTAQPLPVERGVFSQQDVTGEPQYQ